MINDNLQQTIQTVYDYWFTQFDFPDENGKPYRSSGDKMGWNDILKQNIPIEWDVISIDNLANILSGYSFSSDTYDNEGDYRLITIKNVQDTGIDLNVDNYIKELTDEIPDFCILKKGDILLSLTGNVGRVGIIYSENCLLNQRVALIEEKEENIKPFIYALFKNAKMRVKLERMATGTSQKNLSPVETGKVMIPGNVEVIKSFSKMTTPLINIMITNLEENQKLIELRDWLLPMLMNGQATVDD